MADNRTDDVEVDLDLDALERDGAEKPYRVRLGGKPYDLLPPRDIDYRDLMAAFDAANQGRPQLAIETFLPEADRKAFLANKLPIRVLETMFQGYVERFNLQPGKADGSRSSSRGTAKR